MTDLRDKVVAVTGAGGGIGRAHALALATHGASVVVNDLGTDVAGRGASSDAADAVVSEILASGGDAVADYSDVSSWAGSASVVQTAIDRFGRLDGLLNNAGNLRAAPVDELEESDLDALIGTHLRGTYGTTRHACAHWRARAAAGERVRGSVVNTVSEALLIGLPHYAAYSGMKGAIAALTLTLSREGAEYGVRANAYAPRAATRMMPGYDQLPSERAPAVSDSGNSAPLVCWLLSDDSEHVSGQVFQTVGGSVAVCTPWTAGELVWPSDGAPKFGPDQIGPVVEAQLLAGRFQPVDLVRPSGWVQPVS